METRRFGLILRICNLFSIATLETSLQRRAEASPAGEAGLRVTSRHTGCSSRAKNRPWGAAKAATLSQPSCPPCNYTNDKSLEERKSSSFPEAEYLLPAEDQKRLAAIAARLLASLNAMGTIMARYPATNGLDATTSPAPGSSFCSTPAVALQPSSSSSSSSSCRWLGLAEGGERSSLTTACLLCNFNCRAQGVNHLPPAASGVLHRNSLASG